MSFTAPWDETKPAGSRNLNLGDDDIREFKQQVRERAAVDHHFPATDDGNTGYHEKLTLIGQGSDPAQVSAALILYSKTVGSYKELFSRHENAALQQLTLNGKLWIQALTMAGLAQGDVLYFDGSLLNRLAAGSNGQFLQTQGASANPQWANVSGSYVGGSAKNLKVTNNGSNHVVTLTADEVLVDDGAGSVLRFTSVNVTADIENPVGAGGLDTGTESGNTIYYLWLIAKSDGTKALILSLSSSSPTLPSGYTFRTLLSCVGNDNSSNFISFHQIGRIYTFDTWALMANANPGSTWTAIDMTPANLSTNAGFVPSALSNFCFGAFTNPSNAGSAMTNNSSVANGMTLDVNKIKHSNVNANLTAWRFDILTTETLYYCTDGSGAASIYLHGFEINKLAI